MSTEASTGSGREASSPIPRSVGVDEVVWREILAKVEFLNGNGNRKPLSTSEAGGLDGPVADTRAALGKINLREFMVRKRPGDKWELKAPEGYSYSWKPDDNRKGRVVVVIVKDPPQRR